MQADREGGTKRDHRVREAQAWGWWGRATARALTFRNFRSLTGWLAGWLWTNLLVGSTGRGFSNSGVNYTGLVGLWAAFWGVCVLVSAREIWRA